MLSHIMKISQIENSHKVREYFREAEKPKFENFLGKKPRNNPIFILWITILIDVAYAKWGWSASLFKSKILVFLVDYSRVSNKRADLISEQGRICSPKNKRAGWNLFLKNKQARCNKREVWKTYHPKYSPCSEKKVWFYVGLKQTV